MLFKQVITRIQSRIANTNLQTSSFHKSSTVLIDRRWREERRLTKNPNSFGPLTNMPDYSFKDGKPAPFGVKQLIRINKQREYMAKIKTLSGEIDYAVDKHRITEEENAREKQRIIDSKLKPKGHLF